MPTLSEAEDRCMEKARAEFPDAARYVRDTSLFNEVRTDPRMARAAIVRVEFADDRETMYVAEVVD